MSGLVTRARAIGLAIALAIFVFDQWSKHYVTSVLQMQLGDTIEILPFFNFTMTRNYGVSLGMLEATSPEMRWGLVAFTSLIALAVLIWMFRERRFADILPLALVLGGALGNIRDRFTVGYVIDFADLHFGDFRPFLIFNLADAAISIGVVLLLARAFLFGDKPDETPASETTAEAETRNA